MIASAEETVVLSGTHRFNEGEVIWLHLFDINPDFAFAVKVILAAQNIVPDGVNYMILSYEEIKIPLYREEKGIFT